MPSEWKTTPAEIHKIYLANTESFYKAGYRGLSKDIDAFITQAAMLLWSKSGSVSQAHADAANQLYSKGGEPPKWQLWALTEKICEAEDFLPPLFFWSITDKDAKNGTDYSRLFIRMVTNILLYLAAVDDDVSLSEAEVITMITSSLSAICDSAGIKKTKSGINAADYVTSGEKSFAEKHISGAAPSVSTNSAPSVSEIGSESGEEKEPPDLDELLAELDTLVGLDSVKKDVRSLVNLIKVRKLREENSLPSPPLSLHLVFIGNPGTGKTTVARLLSRIYQAIGVLSRGQLVEVDRSGLVAGYVGQTAIKTSEAIKSAAGGVLFIDEAYSLSSGGENDFGREAIEIILKSMEDMRHDLVVIVAGYEGPMEKFISSNPGLESRFNKYFYFPDYTGDELFDIFKQMCVKNCYDLPEATEKYAREFLDSLYKSRDNNFGNGRDVRNIFEKMVSRQADRVSQLESPTKEELCEVLVSDLAPGE